MVKELLDANDVEYLKAMAEAHFWPHSHAWLVREPDAAYNTLTSCGTVIAPILEGLNGDGD